jgi:crotonobetainyl-CoA hydratase
MGSGHDPGPGPAPGRLHPRMTAPDGPDVLLREDVGHVRVLTLHRPSSLNALDLSLATALASAFRLADDDSDVRAIVLTGSGSRAFCAGGDIAQMSSGRLSPDDGSADLVTAMLRERPATPLIAAVNGVALGGGLELVLTCDLAVAAEHATFAIPEASRGVLASGGGLVRLPHVIGPRRALEMAMTGAPIDAQAALAWGLVNRVVRAEELLEAALDLAQSVVTNAPLSVAASKAMIHDTARQSEPDAWDASGEHYRHIAHSTDAAEGLRAFVEKRSPRWIGA